MKLLLDTQCWLWWFAQPERLSEEAIVQIVDETNELWFSVASIWEIGIKLRSGYSRFHVYTVHTILSQVRCVATSQPTSSI
ncbi:hypothetical protein QUB70_03750 [Microcoleus sp. A003_D6]|uniref:type II toxin-antitoxin system VapC family toxin n=1 Tax=Microcoleus sp. A003_D6 TaxID=3055266 RepID=UPI002FD47BDB